MLYFHQIIESFHLRKFLVTRYIHGTYQISTLLLSHEPAGVTDLGALTEQNDVRTSVTQVTVRREPQRGVVGGAGVGTYQDVGETAVDFLPVLLVNSYTYS